MYSMSETVLVKGENSHDKTTVLSTHTKTTLAGILVSNG